jgi:hypothetical protein
MRRPALFPLFVLITALTAAAAAELQVRVVDTQGQPVQGASVCFQCEMADHGTQLAPLSYRTNDDGLTTLKFNGPAKWPRLLYCHRQWTLAGFQLVETDPQGNVVELQVEPAIHVKGTLGSPELEDLGYRFEFARMHLGVQGESPITYTSRERRFQFFVPPGSYELVSFEKDVERLARRIEVTPDHAVLELGRLEVSAAKILKLVGQPAPELPKLKEWVGEGATTLAELRGNVVVLEFWGSWNGNYQPRMQRLRELHNSLKKHGLVIIAIHDGSVSSSAELEEKLNLSDGHLQRYCSESFRVAIDQASKGDGQDGGSEDGTATTAVDQYGVRAFPTGILVNREGKIAGRFNSADRNDVLRLRDWLGLVEPAKEVPPVVKRAR